MTTDTAARSELPSFPTATRVVSYLRVSTGKQAESDLSILSKNVFGRSRQQSGHRQAILISLLAASR